MRILLFSILFSIMAFSARGDMSLNLVSLPREDIGSVSISVVINWSAGSYQGISGDLSYDSSLFGTPQIAVPFYNSHISTLEARSNLLKFCIMNVPLQPNAMFPFSYVISSRRLNISLPIRNDVDFPSNSVVHFKNCSAGRISIDGLSYEAVEDIEIPIRLTNTSARNWKIYK